MSQPVKITLTLDVVVYLRRVGDDVVADVPGTGELAATATHAARQLPQKELVALYEKATRQDADPMVVRVHHGYAGAFVKARVVRWTAAQVVLTSGERFLRRTGRRVGSRGFGVRRIHHEDLARIPAGVGKAP